MLKTTINAFHLTLVNFDCSVYDRDLFSAACLEEFDARPKDHYGYLFAQVFEPHVLCEVSRLEGVQASALNALSYGDSERLSKLRDELAVDRIKSIVERVNLAAALISISRFALATDVLTGIELSGGTDRDRFEVAMLEFVIANRLSDTVRTNLAFRAMRKAAEQGEIPPNRLLDAAAQAVVWRCKGNQVDDDNFSWFYKLGCSLVEEGGGVDAGSRSSWYRAVAMLPASIGEAEETLRFMLMARNTAQDALTARSGSYTLHFMKTYYESTLKEQLYVARNLDAALEAADALIALDPQWSPSYGEQAEVYYVVKQYEQAAQCWERAGRCGPPYVGHHYFAAAQSWEAADAPEKALEIYTGLAMLDPTVANVRRCGSTLAKKLGADSEAFTAHDHCLNPANVIKITMPDA